VFTIEAFVEMKLSLLLLLATADPER